MSGIKAKVCDKNQTVTPAKQTLPQLLQEHTVWNRILAIYRGNEHSPQLSAVAPLKC